MLEVKGTLVRSSLSWATEGICSCGMKDEGLGQYVISIIQQPWGIFQITSSKFWSCDINFVPCLIQGKAGGGKPKVFIYLSKEMLSWAAKLSNPALSSCQPLIGKSPSSKTNMSVVWKNTVIFLSGDKMTTTNTLAWNALLSPGVSTNVIHK